MLGQQTLSAVNCQLPKEASKLALNKGNNWINRTCRGSRPGCPPNQKLTMCFAGRRACAPYGLCCLKINLKIDFYRLLTADR